MYSDEFHSTDYLIMTCSVTTRCVHDWSLRNPTCWFRSWTSIKSSIRFSNTLLKTFPDTDSRVMPLYFSYLLTSFFDIFMRCPSFQSVGTCPSSKTFLNRMWSTFTVTYMSDFSDSGGMMLSGPDALLLLICLMTGHPLLFYRWWSDINGKVCMHGLDVLLI